MTWDEINAAIAEKLTAARAAVQVAGLDDRAKTTALNEALSAELGHMSHEARQFLHDGGHRMATAATATKLQAAEQARKDVEAAKTALEQQVQTQAARIAEIEGKTPDVEAIKRRMQEDSDRVVKDLKTKLEAAEATSKELTAARKGDRVESFVARLQGRLGTLVTKDGLEWAQNRVDRMRLDGRFLPKDAEGFPVAVRRPGSNELEYHASNEDELLQVVSAEVMEGAPPWAVGANVKGGGGATGGGGSAPANQWDKLRADTAARHAGPNDEVIAKRRASLIPKD